MNEHTNNLKNEMMKYFCFVFVRYEIDVTHIRVVI